MALRHLIPVAILLVQYSLTQAAGPLPLAPGNRLAVGPDRDLPNTKPISCGTSTVATGKTKTTRTLTKATSSYFAAYAFTAGPVGSPQSAAISGQFSFAEVKGNKYVYALQVDSAGESAYWLPQGGTIDIPRTPAANQPHFVFTPDFSGCSWTVTPMSDGNLRLRHVEGGKEDSQFNNLTPAQKGGDTTYAMQYKDYGYWMETHAMVGNIPAFAFMQYTGGHWQLTFQRKTCASTPGGYTFKNHLLSSMTMVDTLRSAYRQISGTKTYRIP